MKCEKKIMGTLKYYLIAVIRANVSLVLVTCWLTPVTLTTILSGRHYYAPLDRWGN